MWAIASSALGKETNSDTVANYSIGKWITRDVKAVNTLSWLKFEMTGCDCMGVFKGIICSEFKQKSSLCVATCPFTVEGTTNVHASTFEENASSDMHCSAIFIFLEKEK